MMFDVLLYIYMPGLAPYFPLCIKQQETRRSDRCHRVQLLTLLYTYIGAYTYRQLLTVGSLLFVLPSFYR
jgi:hypothetical protein